MNYYRLHIGDYLRDASHLSLLEHGVFTRLLQVYYTRETPIADAEKYRLIGARSEEERQAVDTVLAEFFTLTDAGWQQSRCDREIAAYQEKADRNREVGRLGGRPVKAKNPEETQTVSTPNPDVTLANSQEPIAKKRERENAPDGAAQSRGSRLPDDFPDAEAIHWAKEERPDLAPSLLAAKFRDYWAGVPGARGRKADWPATWRNFVRSERPPARGLPAAQRDAETADFLGRLTGGLAGTKPNRDTVDVQPADVRRIA